MNAKNTVSLVKPLKELQSNLQFFMDKIKSIVQKHINVSDAFKNLSCDKLTFQKINQINENSSNLKAMFRDI